MSTRSVFDPQIQAKVTACGVIAVLVIDEARDAVPLARALLAGGVPAMELTLRTGAAIRRSRPSARKCPRCSRHRHDSHSAQVDEVVKAGAAFGVAPGSIGAWWFRPGSRPLLRWHLRPPTSSGA